MESLVRLLHSKREPLCLMRPDLGDPPWCEPVQRCHGDSSPSGLPGAMVYFDGFHVMVHVIQEAVVFSVLAPSG